MNLGTTGLLVLAGGLGLSGCTFGTANTRIGNSPFGRKAPPSWDEPEASDQPWKVRSMFGSIPFSAVAADVMYVFTDADPWNRIWENPPDPSLVHRGIGAVFGRDPAWDRPPSRFRKITGAVFSLPVDAFVDAIALPFDLLFWAFGYRKAWPFGGEEEPGAGESGQESEP